MDDLDRFFHDHMLASSLPKYTKGATVALLKVCDRHKEAGDLPYLLMLCLTVLVSLVETEEQYVSFIQKLNYVEEIYGSVSKTRTNGNKFNS